MFFYENHHQHKCTHLNHLFRFQIGFILIPERALFLIYSSCCSCEKEQTQIPGIWDPRHKSKESSQERTGELQPRSQSQLSRGHVQGDSMPWPMTRWVQWRGSSFALLRRTQCTTMMDVDWAGSEGGSVQPFAASQIITQQLK